MTIIEKIQTQDAIIDGYKMGVENDEVLSIINTIAINVFGLEEAEVLFSAAMAERKLEV